MKHWYALRSKPKKEFPTATLLEKVGVEVYLPQVTVHKGQHQQAVVEAFFPGYFFGRLDPMVGQVRLASFTSGILYVVGFDGRPSPVPDDLIVAIRERLAANRGQTPLRDLRPNDRVVITSGPLKDVEAIFNGHLSGVGRAQVLIQILERLCRVEIGIDQLRPVSKTLGKA